MSEDDKTTAGMAILFGASLVALSLGGWEWAIGVFGVMVLVAGVQIAKGTREKGGLDE